MRKSKLAVAIAAAGVVAAGASAFTASSTIDNSTKHVGATGQTISGVHVSNVAYTWDSSTDTTSGVSFHTAETNFICLHPFVGLQLAEAVASHQTFSICGPAATVWLAAAAA